MIDAVGRNSEAYCAVLREIGAIRLTPIAPYDDGADRSVEVSGC
jgi:hypothetical protein